MSTDTEFYLNDESSSKELLEQNIVKPLKNIPYTSGGNANNCSTGSI